MLRITDVLLKAIVEIVCNEVTDADRRFSLLRRFEYEVQSAAHAHFRVWQEIDEKDSKPKANCTTLTASQKRVLVRELPKR